MLLSQNFEFMQVSGFIAKMNLCNKFDMQLRILGTGKEKYYMTHEVLVRFYATNSKECKLTNEFMKEYMQEDGGYINLAKTFMTKGEEGTKENKSFYQALKEGQSLYKLQELGVKIEDLNVFSINCNKFQGEPNQKWHLFIAYYAWKIWKDKLNWDGTVKFWSKGVSGLKCPELLLWLAEAVGCDIAEAKKEAEAECKRGKEINEYKKHRLCACNKIKDTISWAYIEKKIKERMVESN